MAAKLFYTPIPEDIADDNNKLVTEAMNNFGSDFEASKIDIEDTWTAYTIRLFEASPKKQLVIFRPPPSSRFFNCIRVRSPQNAVEWEIMRKSGLYMGLIPVDCQFEAMLVEVKLITQRGGSN